MCTPFTSNPALCASVHFEAIHFEAHGHGGGPVRFAETGRHGAAVVERIFVQHPKGLPAPPAQQLPFQVHIQLNPCLRHIHVPPSPSYILYGGPLRPFQRSLCCIPNYCMLHTQLPNSPPIWRLNYPQAPLGSPLHLCWALPQLQAS